MKNLSIVGAITVLIIIGVIGAFSSCTERIEPGYVGVLVNLSGSDRGLETVSAGRVWYFPWSQEVFAFPTYVQTAKWTQASSEGGEGNEEISFTSREGLVITADISTSYQIVAPRVTSFYVKFRSDNLETFTDGFLRNTVRDAFNAIGSRYGVEEIYGAKKEAFLSEVRGKVNQQVLAIGVSIEQLGIIGAPRLPDQVVQALNAKIAATQQAMRSENELRTSQAEAAKRVAKAEGEARARIAEAEGEAKANLELANSITPNLLEWRKLEVMSKWNGVLPMVSSGGGQGMILQLPMPTK